VIGHDLSAEKLVLSSNKSTQHVGHLNNDTVSSSSEPKYVQLKDGKVPNFLPKGIKFGHINTAA
jgi:hypothetical protein